MNVLTEKENKKSNKLRSEIDKEIGYTEKRNKVLSQLTPLENLKDKSIIVDKELRKRRIEIFCRMINAELEKDQVKESKYLKRMFNGEKIDNVTWDQAVELAKKSNTLTAKIVNDNSSKNISKWSQIGHGFKKALGLSKDKNQCPICKQQKGKSKKKQKKHMEKCNKKLQEKAEKIKKDFVKYQTSKIKKKEKITHTSFNDQERSRYYQDQYYGEKYNGNGLGNNRRGALSGGVF